MYFKPTLLKTIVSCIAGIAVSPFVESKICHPMDYVLAPGATNVQAPPNVCILTFNFESWLWCIGAVVLVYVVWSLFQRIK